jgi:membrane protease subunit (stomatin/prohibitin family)
VQQAEVGMQQRAAAAASHTAECLPRSREARRCTHCGSCRWFPLWRNHAGECHDREVLVSEYSIATLGLSSQ